MGNSEQAIASLSAAMQHYLSEYQELAKTDADFDKLRGHEAFEALLTFVP